jgi:hypothetical protein
VGNAEPGFDERQRIIDFIDNALGIAEGQTSPVK